MAKKLLDKNKKLILSVLVGYGLSILVAIIQHLICNTASVCGWNWAVVYNPFSWGFGIVGIIGGLIVGLILNYTK